MAAARGVGLTEGQIIRQVELPMAIPIIFAGVRTSAVAVVATATITPLANVPSLGTPILEPQTYGDSGQLAAAIVVALITFAVDAGLTLAARVGTPKGLTSAARPDGATAPRQLLPPNHSKNGDIDSAPNHPRAQRAPRRPHHRLRRWCVRE